MLEILFGAAMLYLMVQIGRGMPSGLARLAGIVLLGLGLLLLVTGKMLAALPFLLLGAGLTGWLSMPVPRMQARARTNAGAGAWQSMLRTSALEVQLDPATGRMRGRVLVGRLAGRPLAEIAVPDLLALRQEVDPQSRLLLEAYLDRRSPGWRVDFQQDAAGGPRERDRSRSGAMTKEEAYQVLGVQPGAAADDVRRAHRALIKKLHPDQGGSTYLAARVNEAKDVLLAGHR